MSDAFTRKTVDRDILKVTGIVAVPGWADRDSGTVATLFAYTPDGREAVLVEGPAVRLNAIASMLPRRGYGMVREAGGFEYDVEPDGVGHVHFRMPTDCLIITEREG